MIEEHWKSTQAPPVDARNVTSGKRFRVRISALSILLISKKAFIITGSFTPAASDTQSAAVIATLNITITEHILKRAEEELLIDCIKLLFLLEICDVIIMFSV
ncbi:MAG: hypothetical protein IJ416_07485 [Ruminiclostridium sp.]|nr:hypothetical protein [Ruminiclostridium sp.]